MTQVTIQYSKSKAIVDLIGHAGFNPGNDIVCASISTLAYALYNTLMHDGALILIKDGSMHMEFPCSEALKYHLKMFTVGIDMIAERYPDNVKLKISRCTSA